MGGNINNSVVITVLAGSPDPFPCGSPAMAISALANTLRSRFPAMAFSRSTWSSTRTGSTGMCGHQKEQRPHTSLFLYEVDTEHEGAGLGFGDEPKDFCWSTGSSGGTGGDIEKLAEVVVKEERSKK